MLWLLSAFVAHREFRAEIEAILAARTAEGLSEAEAA
jgi:hypothetical protein